MNDKERLMDSLNAIEDHLCEKEPRVGDALFIIECIKANMEFQDVVTIKPSEASEKPASCNHWPGQPRCGVCGMGMP